MIKSLLKKNSDPYKVLLAYLTKFCWPTGQHQQQLATVRVSSPWDDSFAAQSRPLGTSSSLSTSTTFPWGGEMSRISRGRGRTLTIAEVPESFCSCSQEIQYGFPTRKWKERPERRSRHSPSTFYPGMDHTRRIGRISVYQILQPPLKICCRTYNHPTHLPSPYEGTHMIPGHQTGLTLVGLTNSEHAEHCLCVCAS